MSPTVRSVVRTNYRSFVLFVRTFCDRVWGMTSVEALAAIAERIDACPVPDVLAGMDRCPCGYGALAVCDHAGGVDRPGRRSDGGGSAYFARRAGAGRRGLVVSDTGIAVAVGKAPVTGGRVRQYGSDAERARAWRERQKARRSEIVDTGGDAFTPVLAEASLAVLLDRLGEVGRAHESAVGELIGRVEDAIGALADPEAVAEALAGAKAEAARQVAEAEERAVRAGQAKAAAETAARDALRARAEADEAANGAWERTEALEAELAVVREDLEAAKSEAAGQASRHQAQLEALGVAQREQLAEQQRRAEEQMAVAAAETAAALSAVRDTARVAVAEANAGRDRAEGVASELRAELSAAKQAADAALSAARSEALAARELLGEQLAARYQAQLEAARAKADAEVTRAQARAEGAQELAESRAGEVTRLVTQIDELRADLSRARYDIDSYLSQLRTIQPASVPDQ